MSKEKDKFEEVLAQQAQLMESENQVSKQKVSIPEIIEIMVERQNRQQKASLEENDQAGLDNKSEEKQKRRKR